MGGEGRVGKKVLKCTALCKLRDGQEKKKNRPMPSWKPQTCFVMPLMTWKSRKITCHEFPLLALNIS